MVEARHRVAEPDARYLAPPATRVDSNVLVDVLGDDPRWADWSIGQLARLGDGAALVINPLVLAELGARFERAADLEAALAGLPLQREPLPWNAAMLAGQAFRADRGAPGAGSRRVRSPLPGFYIGAHALVHGLRLLTRDAERYRNYYPKREIISL